MLIIIKEVTLENSEDRLHSLGKILKQALYFSLVGTNIERFSKVGCTRCKNIETSFIFLAIAKFGSASCTIFKNKVIGKNKKGYPSIPQVLGCTNGNKKGSNRTGGAQQRLWFNTTGCYKKIYYETRSWNVQYKQHR